MIAAENHDRAANPRKGLLAAVLKQKKVKCAFSFNSIDLQMRVPTATDVVLSVQGQGDKQVSAQKTLNPKKPRLVFEGELALTITLRSTGDGVHSEIVTLQVTDNKRKRTLGRAEIDLAELFLKAMADKQKSCVTRITLDKCLDPTATVSVVCAVSPDTSGVPSLQVEPRDASVPPSTTAAPTSTLNPPKTNNSTGLKRFSFFKALASKKKQDDDASSKIIRMSSDQTKDSPRSAASASTGVPTPQNAGESNWGPNLAFAEDLQELQLKNNDSVQQNANGGSPLAKLSARLSFEQRTEHIKGWSRLQEKMSAKLAEVSPRDTSEIRKSSSASSKMSRLREWHARQSSSNLEQDATATNTKESATSAAEVAASAKTAEAAGVRVERAQRNERSTRSERGDRGERAERGDRGERAERGDRGERAERGDRGERAERGDRTRGDARGMRDAKDVDSTAAGYLTMSVDKDAVAVRRTSAQRRRRMDPNSTDPIGRERVLSAGGRRCAATDLTSVTASLHDGPATHRGDDRSRLNGDTTEDRRPHTHRPRHQRGSRTSTDGIQSPSLYPTGDAVAVSMSSYREVGNSNAPRSASVQNPREAPLNSSRASDKRYRDQSTRSAVARVQLTRVAEAGDAKGITIDLLRRPLSSEDLLPIDSIQLPMSNAKGMIASSSTVGTSGTTSAAGARAARRSRRTARQAGDTGDHNPDKPHHVSSSMPKVATDVPLPRDLPRTPRSGMSVDDHQVGLSTSNSAVAASTGAAGTTAGSSTGGRRARGRRAEGASRLTATSNSTAEQPATTTSRGAAVDDVSTSKQYGPEDNRYWRHVQETGGESSRHAASIREKRRGGDRFQQQDVAAEPKKGTTAANLIE